MSTVLDVKKSWSLDTSGMNTRTRTAMERYTVLFDGPGTAYEARRADGVPKAQVTAHEQDEFLIATSVEARMVSPIFAEVQVEYGTPAVAGFRTRVGDDGEGQIDLRPQISWSTLESIVDTDQDADGNPIRNTNGDPILIEKKVNDPMLIIVRYFETVDVSYVSGYLGDNGGAVNSDVFMGAKPGQALLTRLEPRKLYFGPHEYWEAEYNIAFRNPMVGVEDPDEAAQKAWYLRHANKGYRVKVGGELYRAQVDPANDGVATSPSHTDWSPTPQEVYLNEDGTRVADGGDAFFILTKRYPALSFAALNIV